MLHPLLLDFHKETCLYQSVAHRQTEPVIVILEQGPEHSHKVAGLGVTSLTRLSSVNVSFLDYSPQTDRLPVIISRDQGQPKVFLQASSCS
jgi:hypothetical protein